MTYNVDKTNYSAYKYSEAVSDELIAICNPLNKHFNIKHFCYIKIFPDGKYLKLSTNLEWQKFYYDNIEENAVILPNQTNLNFLGAPSILTPAFWPDKPNSKLTQAIYDYDLWGGFNFTKFTPECTERWTFFGDRKEPKSNLFYLQHIEVLLQFVASFNAKAKDLLKLGKSDGHKLAFFKKGVLYPKAWPTITDELPVEGFLEDINISSANSLHIDLGKAIITKREFECLGCLAKGKTIKEIAITLAISPRTVETHINHIKLKTGYFRRSELLELYYDNVSLYQAISNCL